MRIRSLRVIGWLVLARGIVAVSVGQIGAAASEPDLIVTYVLHADPQNEQSPVTWKIELQLAQDSLDGTSIGWSVLQAQITQVGQSGAADKVWTETAPAVDTPDGLWWTAHSDPENPVKNEFGVPPGLAGTAAAQDPNDADLDYDVAGTGETPSGSPPFGGDYAMMSLVFILHGSSVPLESQQSTAAEIDDAGVPQVG